MFYRAALDLSPQPASSWPTSSAGIERGWGLGGGGCLRAARR